MYEPCDDAREHAEKTQGQNDEEIAPTEPYRMCPSAGSKSSLGSVPSDASGASSLGPLLVGAPGGPGRSASESAPAPSSDAVGLSGGSGLDIDTWRPSGGSTGTRFPVQPLCYKRREAARSTGAGIGAEPRVDVPSCGNDEACGSDSLWPLRPAELLRLPQKIKLRWILLALCQNPPWDMLQ